MKNLIKKYILLLVVIASIGLPTLPANALPSSFNQSEVISDQDLYSLPLAYSSADRIQAYLESQNSVLATYRPIIGFIDNGGGDRVVTDDLIVDEVFSTVDTKFRPRNQVQNTFGGQTMRVSDLIWKISRENFGNSCYINYNNYRAEPSYCIDNSTKPINPAFLITMIQKESGLIYGTNSRVDPNSDYGRFLLDRALGYYCFENPDRSKSCYDENPNWKYFKGFFQQIYKAYRLLRVRELTCRPGSPFAWVSGNNRFEIGRSVVIDNTNILLRNGITCAMYIYTPHIYPSQFNVWDIMRFLNADKNLIERRGISPDYTPKNLRTFPEEEVVTDNQKIEKVEVVPEQPVEESVVEKAPEKKPEEKNTEEKKPRIMRGFTLFRKTKN